MTAYRKDRVPAWLVAYLLGCIRAARGYDVAREVLLAAPGLSAESYAGPAMARIAGTSAHDDLAGLMIDAHKLRARVGNESISEALVRRLHRRNTPHLASERSSERWSCTRTDFRQRRQRRSTHGSRQLDADRRAIARLRTASTRISRSGSRHRWLTMAIRIASLPSMRVVDGAAIPLS